MAGGNKYIEEEIEAGLRCSYRVKKFLHSGQSKWQSVDVCEIEPFGKCLIIDGLIQSTQVDEFVYHECLVHPAMLYHPNPENVFIGGGGEGSTAREVLRHKSVKRCVMVDIDDDVVKFCRQHLLENAKAFADPRLDVIIDCAKTQLEAAPDGSFDVIIMDLDDPLEGGPCYKLYTKEFYDMARRKLTPHGVLVTQSGQSGIKQHVLVFSPIHKTLSASFPKVFAYNQAVYSFMDEWGWNMGFNDEGIAQRLSPEEVDRRIAERMPGAVLKFLDGESWTGVFALSKVHRQTLAKETCVMTEGNHRFMYNPGVQTIGENAEKKRAIEAGAGETEEKKRCLEMEAGA